jgi:hypothetical protein
MSLTYPIAANGKDALTAALGYARTQSGARREVGQAVTFETDWLQPDKKELEAWKADIQAAISNGSAQVYETEQGAPVLAISFWKPEAQPAEPARRLMAGESTDMRSDHADDLYFRNGRTKSARPGKEDPNQLDLFGESVSEE